MDNDWVKIYESGKQYEIEIISSLLQESEIESVIMNKQDSVYLFGEYELYVKRDDILRAKTLIQNIGQ
jgi:hypothetical protein